MQTFYIICFLTSLVLTLLSFLLGFVHIGGGEGVHVHLDGAAHGGDLGHGAHVGAGAHAGDGGAHVGHGGGGEQQALTASPINLNTLLAFAMGLGGVGFLFTYALGWPGLLALAPGAAGGLAFGWVTWRLLTQLYRASRFLDPAEYRMEGTLGKVTVSIRAGGTGELVYTQGGSRHACGARSADGSAIAKGEEVVILRYEKGIAYVQPLSHEDSGH